MTSIQKDRLNDYIENTLNRKFSVDESDYNVNEICDEMPVNDIDGTCVVFVEANGVISAQLAVFVDKKWRYPVIRNGLVSNDLAPMDFCDSFQYFGYIPYRKPFKGEIDDGNLSEILELVKSTKPGLVCKGKSENGKLIELTVRSSNGNSYLLKKGCYITNGYIDVIGATEYYQCKTADCLLQLIDKLTVKK